MQTEPQMTRRVVGGVGHWFQDGAMRVNRLEDVPVTSYEGEVLCVDRDGYLCRYMCHDERLTLLADGRE